MRGAWERMNGEIDWKMEIQGPWIEDMCGDLVYRWV